MMRPDYVDAPPSPISAVLYDIQHGQEGRSPTPEIRASGLWHVNFVRNSVEPGFTERFEAIVDAMLR